MNALELKVICRGPFPAPEVHTYAVPTEGQTNKDPWTPGGAMPDVWCSIESLAGPLILATIEVSNASFEVGKKARAQCDATVEIVPPAGHSMAVDCPRPSYFPTRWFPMHAAIRRVCFYPTAQPGMKDDAERLAAWGTAITQDRSNYGPCNMPLPKLTAPQQAACDGRIAAWNSRLRSFLSSGSGGPIEDGEDGCFIVDSDPKDPAPIAIHGWRPWGIKSSGAPGGSGIYFWTGYEGSPHLAPYLWLGACCNHERRWHAYDRSDGHIITADDYPNPGPQYQECTGDPNNGWLPEFRGIAQHADPLIPPYDASHSVRGFRHVLALSEMTESLAVRRMLAGQAAQFRLQYSEKGPRKQEGGYWPPNVRNWLGWATNAPHAGHFGEDSGRQIGWPSFLIAQSIKKGEARNIAFAREMVALAEIAAMPNGIYSRCASPSPQSVWYDPNHDTAHAFEVPIFWMGVTGLARQAGLPVPHAMLRAFQCLYEEAPRLGYYSGEFGPPNYLYVAKRGGGPYPTITGGKVVPGQHRGDATHVLTGCALAASENDAPRYLAASAKVGAVFANWKKKAAFLAGQVDLKDSAGLLAQMQLHG